MKIAIVQGPFLPVPPRRGGAVEKMWFGLGPEFARRGHAVTHLSRRCDDLPETETIGGVRHVRVRGYERPASMKRSLLLDLFFAWRVGRVAPAADVVVTNTFWAPVVLPRRCGKIYVDVQRMPKGQLRLYGRAARLRSNSSAVSAAILAELPSAAPRVRMIPNPLPFVPERAPDWAGKKKTVLYAGRIHPEKGIELLLAAWRELRAAGRLRDWTLELVGPVKTADGGGGEAWAEGLRRAGDDGVVWRGPLYDPAALNRAYEQATVFVYPSLAEKGETFGVAVLEAMAWGGLPVVSDLACFRDFVVPGKNGFVFDHRAAEARAQLGAAIVQAAEPAARVLAERTLAVRESHACATIATQFLEDFAELTRRTTA